MVKPGVSILIFSNVDVAIRIEIDTYSIKQVHILDRRHHMIFEKIIFGFDNIYIYTLYRNTQLFLIL